MMDLVRATDARKINVVTFKSFKTVMDKPIVKDKIDDAVKTDACADPKTAV